MINSTQVNTVVIERFRRLADTDRLAHAYLLVGPKDSGKTQTALRVAQLVNCENGISRPCQECPSCRKIASGNHPDVHITGNDEMDSIKIEDIRLLLSQAHLKAYEAKHKVFIIRNIELMTLEAANALLKTLEEPAANTLMVLTTSVPEANLDTIKSRCHIIRLFPLAVNRIAKILVDEGSALADARFLAVYAEGCLGKARKLIKQEIIPRKLKVLDEMLLNKNNESFLKELAADPGKTAEVLGLLLGFFRDVLLLKCGVSNKDLMHQENLNIMEKFSARGMEDLALIIRQIVQTKRLVDEKLNVKMSLGLLREYIWAN